MKVKMKLFSVFLMCFILFTAINRCSDHDNNNLVNGVVVYLGSPAADGCGWAININSKVYKPIELQE
ncbi:hypothetical protein, partial [Ancylomarina longa]